MAKDKKGKDPKATIEIKSTNALIAIFQKLVEATNRIVAAAQKRDQAKNKADEDYETATAEDQATLETLDGAATDYVIEHRKELLPEGKSGIVGPVTVEFRYGNPVLRDAKGKEPKESTILLALDEVIRRARGPNKDLLESCIERKPKLRKQALKELPEELLAKLGLTLVQVEQVSWKANAER